MRGYKRGVLLIAFISLGGACFAQTTQEVVNRMYQNDLTRYENEETFRGEDFITRGEIAKFFSKYADEISMYKPTDSFGYCDFEDIDDYDTTLVPSIYEVCMYGLMRGFEGNFYPNQLITKSEALTVAIRSILGQQDESVNPRRSVTHNKAQNLGLIESQGVRELDEPATRIEIGQWLYMITTQYLPKLEKSSDIGALSAFIDRSTNTDGDVIVIKFDGTSKKIAAGKEFSGVNDIQSKRYVNAVRSADGMFVALEVDVYEGKIIEIYDVKNDLTHTASDVSYGSIIGRDGSGRLSIEVCFRGSDICIQPTSISSKTPWIFPEVRAMGGDIGFVCSKEPSSAIEKLFLNIRGTLEEIDIFSGCVGVDPSQYVRYDIPTEADLAVQGDNGVVYYTIFENEEIFVYKRSQDKEVQQVAGFPF